MPDKPPTDTKNNRLFWAATLGGVLLFAALVWIVDLKWLHDQMRQLNGFLVFALVVVLPLVGVPVSALYVGAGAKFGAGYGLLLAGVAIALHLLGSWWIAHSWLKRPLEAMLRKAGRKNLQVPKGEYITVCLLVALVPGASYTLKNYLLVLAGVPFRPFFWTLLPAHLIHASLAIVFGDFTGAMTTPKIIFLVVYALVMTGLSHRIYRRMKQNARFDPAESSTPLEKNHDAAS
jgi:uncharacterized membrane protein YdjX (TVP38/TMEM64 family)